MPFSRLLPEKKIAAQDTLPLSPDPPTIVNLPGHQVGPCKLSLLGTLTPIFENYCRLPEVGASESRRLEV